MVNELQSKRRRVVKLSPEAPRAVATAKGGAALIEAFASRMRVWSDAGRLLPARRDPRQGFTCEAWLCALAHGLLTGGRGFSATEPMRGDEPLLSILGLGRAPSAETVEEVAKYLALEDVRGHDALSRVLGRQCSRMLSCEKVADLDVHGFVPVWADGTLLETEGRTKDALVCIDGAWGQMACGVFIGPYVAAADFSRATGPRTSEGELVVTRRLLPLAVRILEERGLAKRSLILMDSLYGEDGTLTLLEGVAGASFIVGANRLARTEQVLGEQPEFAWHDTTRETRARHWTESAVCTAYIQCETWEKKRVLVGRRWKKEGEMFYRYSGVITNLDEKDARVAAFMKAHGPGFAQAIWRLYTHKQAMENQWKDIVSGMGLHTTPCGKAAVNAVFLGACAIALNLKTGCARLCLGNAAITLWRFRRDVLDLAATAARHAGRVIVQLLDARRRLCLELDVGFRRLAAL